jgi:hypothetical protein
VVLPEGGRRGRRLSLPLQRDADHEEQRVDGRAQPALRLLAVVAALLGPSDAGKSTLLTAIGLINPPTSGRVLINGRLVMEGPRAGVDLTDFRRNHIGFVFQKSNLVPFLSAVGNVQVALEINGWPAGPGTGRWSCSNTSRWPTGPQTGPACSPAVSSSGWPSPARRPTGPA